MALVGGLGFVAGSAAYFVSLFGDKIGNDITATAGFSAGLIAILYSSFMRGPSQLDVIKAVEAMPGVQKVVTNNLANETLKSAAESADHPKVVPPGG